MSPRTLLCLLPLLGLAVAGCRENNPEKVSVDLTSVVAREWRKQQAAAPRVPEAPAPPPAIPASTKTLPAVAAAQVSTSTREGISREEIRAQLQREIAEGQATLTRRLRSLYSAELRALRFSREREIEAARREGYATLIRELRGRFESYAEKRAPLAARLAFLKGFPDPGPLLEPNATEAVIRRETEAKTIRAELQALDAAFDAYVQSLKSDQEASTAAALSQLQKTLADRRAEIDEQAAREARTQVAQLSEDLDLRLAARPRLKVPALPAETVSAPASDPIPTATKSGPGDVTARKVRSEEEAEARRILETRIRSELKIWSGLQNVTVVVPRSGVRDATAEFERWRSPTP